MLGFPRAKSFLRRFRRSKDGAAALEFAVVGLPFFLFMFAILDISLIFFASTTLENGIVSAARQIRTGKAQATHMTQEQFRTLVCVEISMMLGCDSRLGIDVRKYAGFSNAQFNNVLDQDGNLTGNFQFNPGDPGDVVVVRAFYTWPVMTPIVGEAFQNMAGGHRLIETSIAFRNEPFGSLLAN